MGVVSGCGIAIAHPEGLRAVHTLNRIAPALSTAVFMTSGFLGFASGGVIAAALVERCGLNGLLPLAFCPIVAVGAVYLSRVRLSVEGYTESAGDEASKRNDPRVPFWKVLGIGLPAAVSTTLIIQLGPTYLEELGFGLTFGGFSAAMFGWGGTVGPFLWAAIAHRKGDLRCAGWAFGLSAPLMVLYLVLVRQTAAVWLLFGAGFFSMSAYILTITLARNAAGLNLGQRMAFMMGGTWGIAMVIFLALAALADWLGTGLVLLLTPAGYLLSGLFAFSVLRRYPEAAQRQRPLPAVELASEEHTPL
jgi:hypothetical protein